MKTELLAPAGSMEALKAAVSAGADAVYLGGAAFGARAYAKNLDEQEILSAIDYVHLRNRKLYLTVNTLLKEEELEEKLYPYLRPYYEQGLDAVIVQDMGVLKAVRSWFPDLDIHASTQMTVTGSAGARFLESLGATRVVPARELSFAEIQKIHRTTNLEIECFVHGALCYCYSGQCLFSSLIGGRSGNRGRCAQPCRLPYEAYDKDNHRMGEPGDRYPLSPKDMCTVELLPEIVKSGIMSLKIEGRMKTALYVATVARTYRMAIDDYFENPKKYEENIPKYKTLISQCTYRQYTTGFFFGKPDENTQIYESNTYIKEYTYLGIVGDMNEEGLYNIEQRNKFSVGEQIEVMKPDGENIEVTVKRIVDEEGNDMESAPHPKQVLYIDLGHPLEMYDILRRKE